MLRVSMSNWLSVKSIAVLLPSSSLCSKDISFTTSTSDEADDDEEDGVDACVDAEEDEDDVDEEKGEDDDEEGKIKDPPVFVSNP